MRRLTDRFRRPLKPQYWELAAQARRFAATLRPENRHFRNVLASDYVRYFGTAAKDARDLSNQRIEAAVGWLLRAQRATPDGGVSLGYFPCDKGTRAGWLPSYPETTGYIIASLVDYAEACGEAAVLDNAWEMARWECDVQMPSGAVQSGMICPPEEQVAAVFNTGMVLQGLTALIGVREEPFVFEGARRAAAFLVADQGEDGHFRSHGKAVAPAKVKTYNGLCAWALYRFGVQADDETCRRAAVRAIEASVGEQQANGWFAQNCLTRPEAPLTHTIGYTLQGVLEVGALAGRDDFLEAARRGLDPVIDRLAPDGYLAGRFYADWSPAVFSACLTGTAQLAIVAYRVFELLGGERYKDAADRMISFVSSTQRLDVGDDGIRGAIAGSFPLSGDYMTFGYPNWATKYFLDSLLIQRRLGRERPDAAR